MIQQLDTGPYSLYQRLIAGQTFLRRVPEICKQREVKIPIAIREIVNLQSLDE